MGGVLTIPSGGIDIHGRTVVHCNDIGLKVHVQPAETIEMLPVELHFYSGKTTHGLKGDFTCMGISL